MFETRELGKEGPSDGYHVDEVFFHKFKAFLYLNDVDEKTAPFEFIEGSHRDRNWLNPYKSKILQYDFLKQDKKQGRGNFFSYETVNKIIKNNNFKRNVVTGKAGTLIFFDSKGIHKATTPIKKGRNILANYFEVPRGQIYGWSYISDFKY